MRTYEYSRNVLAFINFLVSLVLLTSVFLLAFVPPSAEAQLRDPTTLELSPSSPTVYSENSVILTATLTSGGEPLANKTIEFFTTNGSIGPNIGTTDSEGKVSVTYTAPKVSFRTSATITAIFAGNARYKSSTASASVTVKAQLRDPTTLELSPSSPTVYSENSVILTATLTSGGEPLANKTIEFSTTKGSVSPLSDTTDANGKATVTYTAPLVSTETSTVVTASFAGDKDYAASSDNSSGTIIPPTVNQPPNASFSFSPTSPKVRETVQFTDLSTDNDGKVVRWDWSFGDGATSSKQSPSHSYDNSGTYTVTLTVTDDGGATDTDSKAITIGAKVKKGLRRTPTTVHSYEPVFVFAKSVMGADVELHVTQDIDLSIEGVSLSDLELSNPEPVSYKMKMIPVAGTERWYLASINPLPAKTVEFTKAGQSVTVKIRSHVTYKLYVNGEKQAQDSYSVQEGTPLQELPPVVYTIVENVIRKPTVLKNTFGLGPEGWDWPEGEPLKTLIVATDDKGMKGIEDVTLQYKIGKGPWKSKSVVEHPIMTAVKQVRDDLNKSIDEIKTKIQTHNPGFGLREIFLPSVVANATIPAQPAGTYVQFRSKVKDVDGNETISPKGLYYTDKGTSEINILMIDADVKGWVAQEDAEQFVEMVRQYSNYKIPPEISDKYGRIKQVAILLKKYGIVPFHHWEHLGSNYNIYVHWPDKEVKKLISNRDVIILSDVWLGFRRMGKESSGSYFWNWDLKDKEVIEEIRKATNEDHVGLITTHGTFSDWIVWTDCKEKKHYKIGTRGQVGDDYAQDSVSDLWSDINPMKEGTIAPMHAMPHIDIFEFGKDKVAYYLCKQGKKMMKSEYYATQAAGAAMYASGLSLGSAPIQVPFVPFKGKMKRTLEGKASELEIPDEFTIEIPSYYQEFPKAGLKSYTQVGWQLAFPQTIAYAALWKAEKARPAVEAIYDKLSKLMENIAENVESSKLKETIDNSLVWAMRSQYKMLCNADIRGTTIYYEVPVPDREETIKKSINLGQDAFNRLLKLLPVKLISMSENALAGIVTYDKYFIPTKGYRSVYFSPEIEACPNEACGELLRNSVEWTQDWRPLRERLMEFLGNLPVPEKLKDRFDSKVEGLPGKSILKKGLILPENGKHILIFSASGEGNLHLVVAHPTSESINVSVEGRASLESSTTIDGVTEITIHAEGEGSIKVGLSATKPKSIFTPVFATIISEVEAVKKKAEEFELSDVTPKEGGAVEIISAKLEVPPNAVKNKIVLTMENVTRVVTPPSGLVILSPVYDIGPAGTTFKENAIITLPYDEDAIPSGMSEEDLAIYRKTYEGWEKLGGTVDTIANTISVSTDHLSVYTVMVSKAPAKKGLKLPLPLTWIAGIVIMVVAIAVGLKLRKGGARVEKEK